MTEAQEDDFAEPDEKGSVESNDAPVTRAEFDALVAQVAHITATAWGV